LNAGNPYQIYDTSYEIGDLYVEKTYIVSWDALMNYIYHTYSDQSLIRPVNVINLKETPGIKIVVQTIVDSHTITLSDANSYILLSGELLNVLKGNNLIIKFVIAKENHNSYPSPSILEQFDQTKKKRKSRKEKSIFHDPVFDSLLLAGIGMSAYLGYKLLKKGGK
jgi:hypothetical protein